MSFNALERKSIKFMKKHFRIFFIDCKKLLKMSYFLNKCNIESSNFSSFINGNDNALSDTKILELFDCIMSVIDEIIYN